MDDQSKSATPNSAVFPAMLLFNCIQISEGNLKLLDLLVPFLPHKNGVQIYNNARFLPTKKCEIIVKSLKLFKNLFFSTLNVKLAKCERKQAAIH